MRYKATATVKGSEYSVEFDYGGLAPGLYRKACDELFALICQSITPELSITTEIFQTMKYEKLPG